MRSRSTSGQQIIALGVTAFFLVIVLLGVSLETVRQFKIADQWVEHTDEVVAQLEKILVSLLDSETGVRGYALSGKTGFLEPYLKARYNFDGLITDTRRLVSDNLTQVQNLTGLENAIQRHFEVLHRIVELKADAPDRSATLGSLLESDKAQMDVLRAMIATMETKELSLLKQRQKDAQIRFGQAVEVSVVLCGLVGIALGVAFFFGARDIRERERREKEITQLNVALTEKIDELTATQTELEGFAYSVAHDLRAPLRHIIGFCAEIEEADGAKPDKPEMLYIDKIASSARRLGNLVDALLGFSRMGKVNFQRETIKLSELAAEVKRELSPSPSVRHVSWEIGPLPEVTGDRAMLHSVFANLISNALKFTRSRAEASIKVGSESRPDETVIYVRDNGVGFDMRHAGQLFGVFQRLHHRGEYEGTGIGLAHVQRVMQRHGGRVWADAKVDEGATFYFSFPINNP